MGLSRSTFYDVPSLPGPASDLLPRIGAICDEFECYGYRRVGAALRHQGVVVNGKKLRRLMRERGLHPKQRRRYITTTDSDHAGPFFPRPREGCGSRTSQPALGRPRARCFADGSTAGRWVADLTYVAITGGLTP
jgi:putative transposase